MEKILIDDICTYRFPENLQYSPDGKYLAFQTAYADTEKNTYKRDVWLMKDKTPVQFTSSGDSSLIFWEDDETMVISRTKEEHKSAATELYRLSVNGGEAQIWITLPFILRSMKKLDAGMYIAAGFIRADDPDAYLDDEKTAAEKAEALKKEADYEVLDEVPYWFNGAGFTNGKRSALFLVKTGGKTEIRRLTDPYFDLSAVIVEDGKAYFTGSEMKGCTSMYEQIYAYDPAEDKVAVLYGKEDHSVSNIYMLDGKLYALASDMKTYGVNETPYFCLVEDGELKKIRKPELGMHCSVATDVLLGGGKSAFTAGGYYYTLETNDDHAEIRRYDSETNETIVVSFPDISCFDTKGGRIAFAGVPEDAPAEVYIAEGTEIRQITELNTKAVEGRYVAKPNRVDYTSHGEELHGWVLLPEDYDPAKKYPAVFDIHGGPRCVYSTCFFHEMQAWAAEGYIVFFTNIRGSDGRGDAFADIRDQYGFVDFDNLMDFTDAVLAAYPAIDTDRICETGGSYGGFMTNWIITHTDRFCCAASQRSISNWISFSLISDIGPWFGPDQCGAKGLFTSADTELLWKHSPLKYAADCHTPTLFIHSDEDYRCPLAEGMQMMQALAVQGIETRMCMFRGENHELSRSGKPQHRLRRLNEITDWFNKHTK
ncbi:MAG: S9 family peptidase [Solobacterium sp.]|nr:S9 family peptidase [Solobacterium sp.]